MYTGLMHSHSSLGYLLALASTISLLLAIATMTAGPKGGVLKAANILRIVEISVLHTVSLLGIAMWLMVWPIASWWAWAGLAVVVLSTVVLARGVKPNIKAIREGATGKSGAWLGAAAVQWLLVMGGIAVMHMK